MKVEKDEFLTDGKKFAMMTTRQMSPWNGIFPERNKTERTVK